MMNPRAKQANGWMLKNFLWAALPVIVLLPVLFDSVTACVMEMLFKEGASYLTLIAPWKIGAIGAIGGFFGALVGIADHTVDHKKLTVRLVARRRISTTSFRYLQVRTHVGAISGFVVTALLTPVTYWKAPQLFAIGILSGVSGSLLYGLSKTLSKVIDKLETS